MLASCLATDETSELTFAAVLDNRPGLYFLDGSFAGPTGPVMARDTVHIPELNSTYAFSARGFVRRDVETDLTALIEMPADGPPLHWPSSAAYDPVRKQIICLTTGGAGPAILYVYDPFNESWITAKDLSFDQTPLDPRAAEHFPRGSMTGLLMDPAAIAYDASGDKMALVLMSLHEVQIAELSSSLNLITTDQFALSDVPEFDRLYDVANDRPPAIVILQVTPDFLVLGAERSARVSTALPKGPPSPDHVYLYDRADGSITLTYRRN